MTQTTVTSDIHEALNVHLHFRTQLTFYFELTGDDITDRSLLFVIPVCSFLVVINFSFRQNVPGSVWSNTINVGKSYLTTFVLRKINTSYTSHIVLLFFSPLPLKSQEIFIITIEFLSLKPVNPPGRTGFLTLALLKTRILLVNHVKPAFATHYFAIHTALFY
jgi:hypothetical protein